MTEGQNFAKGTVGDALRRAYRNPQSKEFAKLGQLALLHGAHYRDIATCVGASVSTMHKLLGPKSKRDVLHMSIDDLS